MTLTILDLYGDRLENLFRRVSRFNIRWKKTLFKDFSSPAVFKDEFLDDREKLGFTRKEMRLLLEMNFISEKTFTDSRGGKRAVVVYRHHVLPQTRKIPLAVAWLKANWSYFALAALLILALCLIPWNKARGFASAPEGLKLQGSFPSNDRGYFNDPGMNVRCYWVTANSGVALSCVH